MKQRVSRWITVVLLVLGPGLMTVPGQTVFSVAARDNNCTAVVDDAFNLFYRGTESSAMLSRSLESYERRLRDCLATSDEDRQDYLLASIDFLQGKAAQQRGDKQTADEKMVSVIDTLKPIVDRGMGTSEDLRLLADTYIARTEHRGKLYGMRVIGDVRRLLEDAVKLNPEDHRANVSLARYYFNAPAALGGDHAKARQHAEIALGSSDNVTRFQALILLADLYRESGSLTEADHAIAQAANIFPHNEQVR